MRGKVIAVSMIGLALSFPAELLAQEEPAARIPLVPSDTQDPILEPIFSGIIERGGRPLNMIRVVGNSPKLFKAYSGLAFAIRRDATVPRVDRELIILRAAQLAKGDYEFVIHKAMGISCGLTSEQVDALNNWKDSDLFSGRQRAILAYADGLASPNSVDDATFESLKGHFSAKEIVELTIAANFYTAAARLTRGLAVELDPQLESIRYDTCR